MNTHSAPGHAPVASDSGWLAEAVRTQLAEFIAPLLRDLDFWIDARLVRTLMATVEAILLFRNRAQGLLLSELGGYLLSPDHAPAGTKRLSNLLHCERWSYKRIGSFLWNRASERLKELETAGDEALVLWDQSVLEKPESQKAEGLCAVRSTKAVRLKRIKPGFYNPPGGRPIFVPGIHWLALMIAGISPKSGAAQVAAMQWWTTRGSRQRMRAAFRRRCWRGAPRSGNSECFMFSIVAMPATSG